MVDVILPTLRCHKCDWKWTPRKSGHPAMCPHCGSRKWDANAQAGAVTAEPRFRLTKRRDGESFLSWLGRLGASIPPEELAKMPTDASVNLDYYTYESPKTE